MISEPNTQSLENNISSINIIAKKIKKRSSPLNLRDAQVSRTPWDWKNIFSDKPMPSDTFVRKVSYKTSSLQTTLRVNDEYLVADVKGSFGDSVICSFAHKNIHIFSSSSKPASSAICKAYECKVYVKSDTNLESTTSLIQNSSFQQLVKAIHLSQKESLHIGNDYASLYLQRFACEDVLKTLDIFYNILALLPTVNEKTLNFENLPENFKELIPWMKKWAISDDNDRADKISKASSITLRRLVQAVTPNFESINHYLDSFKNNPLPEYAIVLGTLAECATEAQFILKARIEKNEKA